MFRAKIPLVAAALLGILTVVVFAVAVATLSGAANRMVESQVEHAQASFPAIDRVRGIEATNEAAQLARDDEFGQVFSKTGDEMRQAAFIAVGARNGRLEAAGRKADLIAVVGSNGHVVSRDLNINAMFDDDLKSKYPSVGRALDGVANKDTWIFDGKMYRVAAAPIRNRAGVIVGALVVGYVASAKEAAADRQKLGTEVAYFLDGKVQASSFSKGGGESAEEKALAAQLFDGPKLAAPALAGEWTKLFTIKIGGEEFIGAGGPLSGNTTRSQSGFVVLSSATAARGAVGTVPMMILLLGLAGLVASIVAAVLTARRFIQPLDKLESGVAEVINGNRDYSFDSPSADYEGLANGLNVMLARLLGRPDPTDSDDDAAGAPARWQGEFAVDEPSTASRLPTPNNAELATEPEAQYYARLFNEYVQSRQSNGEGTEGLALEGFSAKLKQNEAVLRKKYNCRLVRFKVVVKNKQTTLKPVPIA